MAQCSCGVAKTIEKFAEKSAKTFDKPTAQHTIRVLNLFNPFPTAMECIMEVKTYSSGRTNVTVHPNLIRFFDEEAMSKKLEALSEHVSQKAKYGDESWLKSVESIARADAWRYGGKHGCAELFQISRTTVF